MAPTPPPRLPWRGWPPAAPSRASAPSCSEDRVRSGSAPRCCSPGRVPMWQSPAASARSCRPPAMRSMHASASWSGPSRRPPTSNAAPPPKVRTSCSPPAPPASRCWMKVNGAIAPLWSWWPMPMRRRRPESKAWARAIAAYPSTARYSSGRWASARSSWRCIAPALRGCSLRTMRSWMPRKSTRSQRPWSDDAQGTGIMITDSSVEKFLDELASGNPTPGGGSAAAIMGAMGAALVSMVCNVTIGKKGYEAVEAEMKTVRDESERVRRRLTAMVAEDIEAFDSIMAAYKLPKATDEEKARRGAAIQAGLERATETPLDCARACAEVIALSRRASERGYLNVISDGGVGVLAGFTGLGSAALNVYINAPALKDRSFAEAAIAEIEKLVEFGTAESEAVYKIVRDKLG